MDNNLYCLQNVCRFFICDLFGIGFMTDVFDFVFFLQHFVRSSITKQMWLANVGFSTSSQNKNCERSL